MERDLKQKLMQPNRLQETNWSDLRSQCNQNSLFGALALPYHRSIASACSLTPRRSDHLLNENDIKRRMRRETELKGEGSVLTLTKRP